MLGDIVKGIIVGWCKVQPTWLAEWIYECMSEILSVREVKRPVILSVITADDRGSLRQSGCSGFTVFFKLKQLSYILCPMKTNCCSLFHINKAVGIAAAWLKLKGKIKISFKRLPRGFSVCTLLTCSHADVINSPNGRGPSSQAQCHYIIVWQRLQIKLIPMLQGVNHMSNSKSALHTAAVFTKHLFCISFTTRFRTYWT